jgi:hypothetical protein
MNQANRSGETGWVGALSEGIEQTRTISQKGNWFSNSAMCMHGMLEKHLK